MSELLIVTLITICAFPFVVFMISLINYRIDDRHVRCYWGPVPVRKIAMDDIRDAVKGYRHMSESWTNTIWMPTIRRRGVILYRRTGRFRRVVITPDDPEGFIERIKAHERFFRTPVDPSERSVRG
jgi:hypothetical protein